MSNITNPIVLRKSYSNLYRVLGSISPSSGPTLILIDIGNHEVSLATLSISPVLACPTIDVGNGIEKIIRPKKMWYVKDYYFHREDGPAVIWENGADYDSQKAGKEFWLHGQKYSAEEYFEALTPEQKEKAVWNLDEIK